VRLTFVSGNLRARINNFTLKNELQVKCTATDKSENLSFGLTYTIVGNEPSQKDILESKTEDKKTDDKVKLSF
jgi:hypothetical protein